MPTSADVVATARRYLNTPFAHEGRVRGRALDCVGLPICVAIDLGLRTTSGVLIDSDMFGAYPRQPCAGYSTHETAKKTFVMLWERSPARRNPSRELLPGRVLSLLMDPRVGVPFHAAIVTAAAPALTMIHCLGGGRARLVNQNYRRGDEGVREHIIDQKYLRRIMGVFRFPGVAE
jgi:hypothetical protein